MNDEYFRNKILDILALRHITNIEWNFEGGGFDCDRVTILLKNSEGASVELVMQPPEEWRRTLSEQNAALLSVAICITDIDYPNVWPTIAADYHQAPQHIIGELMKAVNGK